MDENEGRPVERDAEPPWEGFRRWCRALWWRLSLKPRDLTPADIVPPGAQPICPACVLPHHPAAARCPNCGEIVTPYATIMSPVWIWVWGPKLQRVVRQERLSRLLWAGILVSALAYLLHGTGATSGGGYVPHPMGQTARALYIVALPIQVVLAAICLGATFQMLKAAIEKWGTWREDAAEEPPGG